MPEPEELLIARFTVATRVAPYLSDILYNLRWVPTENLGTVGCDMSFRLYYDPVAVPTWPIDEIVATLEHECWHLACKHPTRGKALGPGNGLLKNLAADLAINSMMAASGKLPKVPPDRAWVLPATYGLPAGETFEWYYHELLKMGRKVPKHGRVGQGHCGSCAGNGANGESGNADETGGLSELAASLLVDKVLKDMAGRGDVPEQIKQWAEEQLKSKVNWKVILSRAIRNSLGEVSGALDYSSTIIDKRRVDLLLPGMCRFVPSVGIVADTSGSMSREALSVVRGEIGGILQSLGYAGVPYFSVDAEVHVRGKIFSARDAKFVGGGGTDMAVGIAACEKEKVDLCIVLTDGQTPWGTRPRRMRVLAGIVGEGASEVPVWVRPVKIPVV